MDCLLRAWPDRRLTALYRRRLHLISGGPGIVSFTDGMTAILPAIERHAMVGHVSGGTLLALSVMAVVSLILLLAGMDSISMALIISLHIMCMK